MNNIHNEQKARRALDNHISDRKAFWFKAWFVAVVVIAVLTAINAQAATVELASGVYTHHIEEYNTARNEDNDLLALTYRFDDSDWGILATTFNNSYDVQTYGLALTYSVFKWRAIELELIGGVMKGYTEWELHDKLCPFGEEVEYCLLLAPKLSLEIFSYKGVTPKLSVLYMGEAVVVTAGVSYKF